MHYPLRNIMVGVRLEESVKSILKKRKFSIKPHKVTDPGLDAEGKSKDRLIAIECLNFWGGFLNGERFKAIVKNLVSFPGERYLVCCGVKPSKEQYRLSKGYGIKIVFYPKQISKPELAFRRLIRKELNLGVITSTSLPRDEVREAGSFLTSDGLLVFFSENRGCRFKLDPRIWQFSIVLYLPEKRSMKGAPRMDGRASLALASAGRSSIRFSTRPTNSPSSTGKAPLGD